MFWRAFDDQWSNTFDEMSFDHEGTHLSHSVVLMVRHNAPHNRFTRDGGPLCATFATWSWFYWRCSTAINCPFKRSTHSKELSRLGQQTQLACRERQNVLNENFRWHYRGIINLVSIYCLLICLISLFNKHLNNNACQSRFNREHVWCDSCFSMSDSRLDVKLHLSTKLIH